jgi:hypothetical protein
MDAARQGFSTTGRPARGITRPARWLRAARRWSFVRDSRRDPAAEVR